MILKKCLRASVGGFYENVVDDKKYWIGTTDFLAAGGDGYQMIREERLFYQKGRSDSLVLVDEIIKRSPITEQKIGNNRI